MGATDTERAGPIGLAVPVGARFRAASALFAAGGASLVPSLLRSVVLLVGACLGCAVPPPNVQAEAAAVNNRDRKRDLAEGLRRVLTENEYVSFRVDVTAPPYRVVVDTEMAQRRLKTVVWVDGQWAAAFVVKDGRVHEYRAGWKPDERNPNLRLGRACLSYDAYLPEGTNMTFLAEKTDCLFGSYLGSWVGENAQPAAFLWRRIEEGTLLADEMVGQQRCQVLVWEQRLTDYYRQDKFFFSTSTGFLARWETNTEDKSSGPTTRVREFSRLAVGPLPPEGRWAFDFPAEPPQATSQPQAARKNQQCP